MAGDAADPALVLTPERTSAGSASPGAHGGARPERPQDARTGDEYRMTAPQRYCDTMPQIRRPVGSLLVALVTPLAEDGSVDLGAAARLADKLVSDGCDGVVVSGTTGESPTTTDAEKDALLRAVVEAVGDRATVVAGVGTNDTAHSIALARAAEAAGADALLVVTPYYSKPTQAGLVHHFRAVADGAGLPVVLYDIPGRSGVRLSRETLLDLAGHPRIVAVKDATGDVFAGSRIAAETDLAYYSGDDGLNLAWLAEGASGCISVVAHAAAPVLRTLVDAFDRGDTAAALAAHRRLVPAVVGIMQRMPGVVAAKAALQLQGILGNRLVRSPMIPATPDQIHVLHEDLTEAELL